VSRPAIYQYTVKGQTGKPVKLHYVQYRVYLSEGAKPTQVKVRGFARKGLAETFVDNVERAKLNHEGWVFNDKWRPVHNEAPSDRGGQTSMELIASYWSMHRPEWSPSNRSKVRGRLLVLTAVLMTDHTLARQVVAALKLQRPGQGRRALPSGQAAWIARYLYDCFLRADGEAERDRHPELIDAEKRLASCSIPATAVSDMDLRRVRTALTDDRPYNTARTYWATISAVFEWAVETGRLPRHPAQGMPKIARDFDAEKVDPERVPDVSEIWLLAETALRLFGEQAMVIVLLLAFGALRINECLGLLRSGLGRKTEEGKVWVTARSQSPRVTKQHSLDGASTHESRPPKGRTKGPAARKTFCLSPRVAARVLGWADQLPAEGDGLLFLSKRGGQIDAGMWRETVWDVIVAEAFPEGHRLSGITPHALRHAGMTYWLRMIKEPKTIQLWGGWKSLKVMLDIYAAVLPNDNERAAALLIDEEF
jgi:integrase